MPKLEYEYDFLEVGPYDRNKLEAAEHSLLPTKGERGWQLTGVTEHSTTDGLFVRRYYFTRPKLRYE